VSIKSRDRSSSQVSDDGSLAPNQQQRFIETARALSCDENPVAFDEKLKVIARHKPKDAPPEKPLPKRTSKAP